MKDTTFRILLPLLESDETIAPEERQRAVDVLLGQDPMPGTDQSENDVPEGYLRKLQAAEYLGISPRTLSQWMTRRAVPYYKIGQVPLFRREELDQALRRFRYKAAGDD